MKVTLMNGERELLFSSPRGFQSHRVSLTFTEAFKRRFVKVYSLMSVRYDAYNNRSDLKLNLRRCNREAKEWWKNRNFLFVRSLRSRDSVLLNSSNCSACAVRVFSFIFVSRWCLASKRFLDSRCVRRDVCLPIPFPSELYLDICKTFLWQV